MLSKSDKSIADVISKFQSLNIDASFIVPTNTGMNKSILDATFQIREYFKLNNYHDYHYQNQGLNHKEIKRCFFISENNLIESKVSLYRPETKKGDPRIWFYSLKEYAKPNDLLALIILDSDLYILNCSNPDLFGNIQNNIAIQNKLKLSEDIVFNELLNKMIRIYGMGFIKSVGIGPKAVGETLENRLDINPNSSKNPDYKGIELKSSRSSKHRGNLFSKVPNWNLSRLKGTKQILDERGIYSEDDKRIALYHTIKANVPNSYDLLLRVDEENNFLKQNHLSNDNEINDVVWLLTDLKESLIRKHPKSFWVKADVKKDNQEEYFHYKEVIYTHSPNPYYFITLLKSGVITVDYLMHYRENGRARDHGYLFKILPENLEKLFPKPKVFDLSLLS